MRKLIAQMRPATAAAVIAAATTPDLPASVIPTRAAVRGLLIPGIDWSRKRLGPIKNTRRKVHRNEACPFCESGKKFKFCCKRIGGAKVIEQAYAGHPQEKPFQSSMQIATPKGPRPAERKVVEE